MIVDSSPYPQNGTLGERINCKFKQLDKKSVDVVTGNTMFAGLRNKRV